ncbi:MAG: hypothetical protein U5L46_12125 [Agrobacterium sp.]|nr:hypothetical protein [Agrobacterium sp.]
MISRIERGEVSPTAQLLAKALQRSLDHALGAFFAFDGRGGHLRLLARRAKTFGGIRNPAICVVPVSRRRRWFAGRYRRGRVSARRARRSPRGNRPTAASPSVSGCFPAGSN